MARHWRRAYGIVSAIADRHRRRDWPLDRAMHDTYPLQIGTGHELSEVGDLQEFIKVLNVGDRIRVLCDDGVLVAEKVSNTQFELIQYQMMSDLIH